MGTVPVWFKKTLENIDGVSNIFVDLEGKKASFEVKNEILVEKAVSKVTNAGYKASIV